jgi:hypothetical protein
MTNTFTIGSFPGILGGLGVKVAIAILIWVESWFCVGEIIADRITRHNKRFDYSWELKNKTKYRPTNSKFSGHRAPLLNFHRFRQAQL